MNGHARGRIHPSPFEQHDETSQGRGPVNAQLPGRSPAVQSSASGQMASQMGSQGQFPGAAGSMHALQMMQARALQQQQQQQQQQASQAQSHKDVSAQQQFQAQILQQHLLMQQQQQLQKTSEPLALQHHEYQQRLQATLQQRQSSLAALQHGGAAAHAALSPEHVQQLQALQQRRSSLSSIGSQQQEPESPQGPMSQQPPPPRMLQSQQQPQEQQQQAQPGLQQHSAEYLQQLLQQRQAILEQQHSQQHSQPHDLQRRQSGQSDAQNMEGDYPDSKSGGPSGQQTPGELQTSMSCESAQGRAQGSSPRGLPEGAKTAGGSPRLASLAAQQLLKSASRLDVGAQAHSLQLALIQASAWLSVSHAYPQGSCRCTASIAQRFHILMHIFVDLLCMPAALMQGMLQALPKRGTQKQPAARLMLETLLDAVSSIRSRNEESAETQQAIEVAVQVWRHTTFTCLTMPMHSQSLTDLLSRI